MTEPRDGPRLGGGIFLAIGPIVGTVGGLMLGQPSIGFLAGVAAGALLAAAIWLKQR